ncbi:RmlC-like cupin [Glarea lozoyensis ATCC 20868]|uniref:RmlC-like cupin n=1 Tax=Glarea lozoyensis (strain ATCC 20868 / MF5171) TaxID=1116229 RepID=S3DAT1_GLAL2|nr:RmlC-like cupin [Glarea lozoyensis ATCC 20868]EPE34800.1 RmlC-like cupin [Glarea lozoyensis ATCC 20868]
MTTSQPQQQRQKGLPDVQRIITDHDSDGKAVVSTDIPSQAVWQPIGPAADFFLGYTTRTFPVVFKDAQDSGIAPLPQDIKTYKEDMVTPPGLTISTGTVLRYVDMAPNALSPMHRTVSLDYGIVLEGEIELVLDSGETRLMKRGDVCIQRATNHAWRNVTANGGWARMVYVLIGAEKVDVGGKSFEEDLGDMPGVRASD